MNGIKICMYRSVCMMMCIFCFNPLVATVFNNANQHINVYGDDVEVDYRGYEVC